MFTIQYPLSDRKGKLFIEDVAVDMLAKEFKTPLYVYSESHIRKRCRDIIGAFSKHYPRFLPRYAIKANNNPALLRVIRSEGFGFDASGPHEIELSLAAGAHPSDIIYSGNNHRNEELQFGLDKGVLMNLDDLDQIERLKKLGVPDFVSFRINPMIAAGDIKGLVFAGADAKIGILEDKDVEAYGIAKEAGARRFGIHMMTGSCVLDSAYFAAATEKLLMIAGAIRKKLGITFEVIDVGGGLGVTYRPGEKDLELEAAARGVAEAFSRLVPELELGNPHLMIEPGRYIVCEAGFLLTRVHSIKQAQKRFVGVDAGMHCLLRPALYDAYHHIVVDGKLAFRDGEKVNVVGPVCENTDQLAKDRELPRIGHGDLLAIFNAGAYGFSMGSNYNTREMPAEVLVHGAVADLIRKRESLSDFQAMTVMPARLQ